MSTVKKEYITVQSRIKPKYEKKSSTEGAEDEPDLHTHIVA
jgi:hypothetical protein